MKTDSLQFEGIPQRSLRATYPEVVGQVMWIALSACGTSVVQTVEELFGSIRKCFSFSNCTAGDSNLKTSISSASFRSNERCSVFRDYYLTVTDNRFADSEPWMVGDSNDAIESSAMLG
jgi:hypothetical protein